MNMDETKVQIGNDVLLDVGINPDWYISSVGYEYGYEEKAREVTITLRNRGDENKLWRTLGELITDRKTENCSEKPNNSTISKMEQVDKDINVRRKDEPQTDCQDWKYAWWNGDAKRYECTVERCQYEDEPQTEYERASEQREHDILYEPTYDLDDGSM